MLPLNRWTLEAYNFLSILISPLGFYTNFRQYKNANIVNFVLHAAVPLVMNYNLEIFDNMNLYLIEM